MMLHFGFIENDKTDNAYSIPFPHTCPLPAAVRRDDGRISWILSPDHALYRSDRPDLFISLKEESLSRTETWKFILNYITIHRAHLARWHRDHPEIPDEAVLEAAGMTAHYRNLSDWNHWKKLSESAAGLAVRWDLPLTALLLWDSLEEKTREYLTEIFNKFIFKKNLIKEIIEIAAALSPDITVSVLKQWSSGKEGSPAALRNLLRSAAFPEITEYQKKAESLIKALRLPRGMTVTLPADFEGGSVNLSVSLDSEKKIRELRESLSDPAAVKTIEELIRLVH